MSHTGIRRACLAVVLLALFGSTGCQAASAASWNYSDMSTQTAVVKVDWDQVAKSSPEFLGVEYGWVDQDRQLFLERYQLLAPNVVRVQVTQEIFESVNDNADPEHSQIDFNLTLPQDAPRGKTITYRDFFTSLGEALPELHFQINLWLPARWNASRQKGYLGLGGAFPPKNMAEHREFVRELARWLVQTCRIAPERLSFTFVNEPNLKTFSVGTAKDLVKMAAETRSALDEISPEIGLGGLDEVHGTKMSDAFYRMRPAGCCSPWTFHVYERGIPALWKTLEARIEHLQDYGPVWVTEFADTRNGSPDAGMDFSTPGAAIGFSELLGRLWGSGVNGIVHFRLGDTYLSTPPFNGQWAGHGLFADWRGTKSQGQPYELYPAFWVFANFYREMGGGKVLLVSDPSRLLAAAARHDDPKSLVLWVTNPGKKSQEIQFEIQDLPFAKSELQVLDNLAGTEPIEVRPVSGQPLFFLVRLPPGSSRTLKVSPLEAAANSSKNH